MSSSFEKFRNLHSTADLLVLPNAWDAKSAMLLQEEKFPAVATSSAAVAGSLGYGDGEEMPLSDYLFVISRILASIKIPLSVDIEMGYGRSDDAISNNVQTLVDLGIAGINIEDSTIEKSGRVLKDANLFAKTIENIKSRLASKGDDLFVNIRCDTYILNVDHKKEETKRRLKLYEAAGANGIFLPCIALDDDIAEAVSHTKLPLNVMCIPGLPGFERLRELGVKRVSMGPFLFNTVYDNAGRLGRTIIADRNFSSINHQ